MQKSVHFRALGKPGLLALFVAAWTAGLAPAYAADAFATDWSEAGDAQVRVVAAAGPADGVYRALVQIRLAPGWLTYWRDPGDAGVPPVFTFAGSDNLDTAKVDFPPPERIDEAGGDAFGYRTGVDIALSVTARDPTSPVALDMALDYAICARICVPAKAHARLELKPAAAGPYDGEVAAGFARLPVPLSATATAASTRLQSEPGAAVPSWRLTWTDAATLPRDLFVEAPEGWYVTSRKGDRPNEFVLAAIERPKDAAATDLRLTSAGPAPRAFGLHLTLPP